MSGLPNEAPDDCPELVSEHWTGTIGGSEIEKNIKVVSSRDREHPAFAALVLTVFGREVVLSGSTAYSLAEIFKQHIEYLGEYAMYLVHEGPRT